MKNQTDRQAENRQQTLQSIFSSSLILGGSPCSGKTTVAERLSRDLDIPYYKVDDHQMRHIQNATQDDHPTMYAYAQLDWDEIWSRPVELQVQEEFSFYKERFEMILNDLLAYKNKNTLIIEGAALLPTLLHSWGVQPQQVLFLVPTKKFQIDHYSQRPWIQSILKSCKNPQKAFSNWMERDHQFGLKIIDDAIIFNYPYIIVDGSLNEDDLYEMAVNHFQL